MEEDKFNKLPNDIIVHIISFLPTRDAVGTSVLSRRWKHLWTLTATLDFCDNVLYDAERMCTDPVINTKFMVFVERVLLLYDRPEINKFILSCYLRIDYDATWFDTWFSRVLEHSIQELILTISLNLPYYFPQSLSHCQSLTTLRLHFESDGYIKISGSLCFPKLKFLYLNFIAFYGEQSVQSSYLSFPVLQEFCACNFSWVMLNIVNIYAPTLKRFTVDDYPVRGVDTVEVCEIILCAERLTFLKLTTNLSCKYSLHNPLSLVDAFIDVPTAKDMCHRMINLLGGICNVQDLKLSDNTIENLFNHDAIVHLPTFSSLTHLTVIVECDGFDAQYLIKLLHKLPNVKSLVFEGPYTCEYVIEGSAVENIPQCLLTHLKSVEIGYFDGSEYEVCLVEFFLKNAVVLESMCIFLSKDLSRGTVRKEKVSEKLYMLPRGSTCCVVNLHQSIFYLEPEESIL